MKTIADIKRAMTLGSRWHTVHHGFSPDWMPKDLGIREITIVQTKSVAFKTERGNSWIAIPNKSQVIFENENTFSIIDSGFGKKPILTYTLIT